MNASAFDSAVFRDIFSTEAMRRDLLRREPRAVLPRYRGGAGPGPGDGSASSRQQPRRKSAAIAMPSAFDMALLKTQTERIGYPVLPVVQQLVGLCRDGLGEWCHWGATTQDITDTATVLQIRDALALVEQDLHAIAISLAGLARAIPRHADGRAQQPAAGRADHLRLQMRASCSRAFERHRARLAELRPRVLVGEFGGAAGTLASLGADGLEGAGRADGELGLGQPEIAWHTMRDRIAEAGCFLGLVTGTLGKIATDVKLMMQTEVEEVYEPFAEGRGSQQHHAAEAQPDLVQLHPSPAPRWCARTWRRCSTRWSRITSAPPARGRSSGSRCRRSSCLSAGALAQARFLVGGLQVDPARMRANLDLTSGLIVSEAVMMGLGPRSAGSARTTSSTTSAAR